MDRATAIIPRMRRTNSRVSVTAYNALLHGFRELRDIPGAASTFDELQSEGVEPNVATYTLMIGLYADVGDKESCLSLYRHMLTAGVVADKGVDKALLEACRMGEHKEEALALIRGMRPKELEQTPLIESESNHNLEEVNLEDCVAIN